MDFLKSDIPGNYAAVISVLSVITKWNFNKNEYVTRYGNNTEMMYLFNYFINIPLLYYAFNNIDVIFSK